MSCCPTTYWCTPDGPVGVEADEDGVFTPPEGATSGPYATYLEAVEACTPPSEADIVLQCCSPPETPDALPGNWLVEWDTALTTCYPFGVGDPDAAFAAYLPTLTSNFSLTSQAVGGVLPGADMVFRMPLHLAGTGGGLTGAALAIAALNIGLAANLPAFGMKYVCGFGGSYPDEKFLLIAQRGWNCGDTVPPGTLTNGWQIVTAPPYSYNWAAGLECKGGGILGFGINSLAYGMQKCAGAAGGPALWTPPTIPGGETRNLGLPSPNVGGWIPLCCVMWGSANGSNGCDNIDGFMFGFNTRYKLHAL